jgi:hypothetical protein
VRILCLAALAVLLAVASALGGVSDGITAEAKQIAHSGLNRECLTYRGPADTFEVIIALDWVGRSTEMADSCPYGSTIGSKLAEGLALSLDPKEVVFDNGIYTPEQHKKSVPHGVEWVSWPHWHPWTWEVRHLRGTFSVPVLPDTVLDLFLFSPYYTEFGNILPLNDNVYLYLNGVYVGVKGSYLGAKNGGHGGTAPFANETDGWYEDTGFGPIPTSAFRTGQNALDLVTEEHSGWGGIGRLDLKLLSGTVQGAEEGAQMPQQGAPLLRQNSPNPFNRSTLISCSLPQAAHVTLSIYDISGRLVETLVNETQQSGMHQVQWNRKANPSGVYFYRLNAGSFTTTKKMVVVE